MSDDLNRKLSIEGKPFFNVEDDFNQLFDKKIEKQETRKKKEIHGSHVPLNLVNSVNNGSLPGIVNNDLHHRNPLFTTDDSNDLRYDYDYKIILLNKFEEGFMDTYLTGRHKYYIENNAQAEAPRSDPAEYFNFGLDEEKWIKFINKSVLMHYEKHLLQAKLKAEQQKGSEKKPPPINYMDPYQRPYMMGDSRMMAGQYMPPMYPIPNYYHNENNIKK